MNRVFLSYSYDRDREFVTALKQAVERVGGMEIIDPAVSLVSGAEIASEILTSIQLCDVFVSIVGLDRPNTLLETGIAIGAGKDLLLVARSLDPLPFNLRALPVVQLSGDAEADSSLLARRLATLKSTSTRQDPELLPVEELIKALRRDPRSVESLSPRAFEHLVAEVFSQHGYTVEQTGPTHDTGVDLLVKSPDQEKVVAVQCKRYSRQSRVSIGQVRDLLGAAALTNADVAVLVTTSGFTAGAKALAADATKPRLVLLGMDRFMEPGGIAGLWDFGLRSVYALDWPGPTAPTEVLFDFFENQLLPEALLFAKRCYDRVESESEETLIRETALMKARAAAADRGLSSQYEDWLEGRKSG